ncbi:alpha/beta fold hydrolase [Poritiphilus flavus]|uniref:Alpha/beta fold hydrolase n=1 Tax=Poritiphilus flavus TaxID=2697053 RepID=A0A6L9E998_9FLAO|nr:alpha/beta fold hydrolase [Poritiphilus flavus]NAS11151.1 alpha/beta fold hydrolase [Poritiphilus flavus]
METGYLKSILIYAQRRLSFFNLPLMNIPNTLYARSKEGNLAYQIIGDKGDFLILIPGWISNIEAVWDIPEAAAWLRYIASFSKLVIFDKRGTGLSDNINENEPPGIQERANDLEIILSQIGVKKANFIGLSEGGALALRFAVQHPGMVSKLILIGSFAKWLKSDSYPYGLTKRQHLKSIDYIFEHWGEPVGLKYFAPSVQHKKGVQKQWSQFLRRSASPTTARKLYEMNIEIDVTSILRKVQAPTLIIHREGDRLIESQHSQYIHDKIPNSQLILSSGNDHLVWFGEYKKELLAIQTFVTGERATVNSKLEELRVEDLFKIYQIRDFLETNYPEEITISSLARSFGINQYKIKTAFSELFETPVIHFLTDIRLSNASRLLTDPEESIASIAEKVGYKHSNNFSIAFKRKFNMNPTEFRKRLQSKK